MIDQLTQPALFSFIIVLLGFFIKKWISMLEGKLDKIETLINTKIDKEEFRARFQDIEKKCEKRGDTIENIANIVDTKTSKETFFKHSHSEHGGIIL